EEMLKANDIQRNERSMTAALSASRALYVFISDEAETESKQYASEHSSKKMRPVRGPVVLQFDLVIQILSQVLEYARQHPLDTAVGFAVLEDYLERKLGPIVASIWRKIRVRKADSSPKKEIIRILQIERILETPQRRKKTDRRNRPRKSRKKRSPTS